MGLWKEFKETPGDVKGYTLLTGFIFVMCMVVLVGIPAVILLIAFPQLLIIIGVAVILLVIGYFKGRKQSK